MSAGKVMFFTLKKDQLELLPPNQQTWPTMPRYAGSGAVSPDGQYIVCETYLSRGSERLSAWLTIWSVHKAMIVRDIPSQDPSLSFFRFDVNGRYLSVTKSEGVTVWDFAELIRPSADSTPSLSQ
jgi:hypothetical protein